MLTKANIALAAVLILGPATAALASDTSASDERGGGPTQTWQDIERSAQYIQDQIKGETHSGTAGNAYGLAKPAKHPVSH